ncbi:MAG: ABC transporter permease subunit [Termitinemataceae bacterium]
MVNGIAKGQDFYSKLKRQYQLFFMSTPLVLYVVLFAYVPLWGWTMAFQNFRPARNFFQQEWVGFKWFLFLFKDDNFLKVLRNTIAMSLINLAFGYISAITLAIVLNEVKERLFKRAIQTISYLPHFLSWVIVSGLVASMLSVEDGAVNQVLLAIGLIKEPIMWLGEPKYFWWITGFTHVWKEVGWNSIIYLAAISGIDPTLYEVAEIDGCNRLKKIWYITLPGIKATIIVLLIMSIGHILDSGFELQFLLRNGLIQDYSDTIEIYVLTYGLNSGNYSLATAAGMFKNVVNVSLIFLANFLARRMGEERLI